MRTEHTPGPWHLVPPDAPKSWPMIAAKVGERKPLICCLEYSKRGPIYHDDAVANARLIAAAPELLEALIEMVRDFGVDGLGGEFEDGECKVVDKARAAIAKATGGEV